MTIFHCESVSRRRLHTLVSALLTVVPLLSSSLARADEPPGAAPPPAASAKRAAYSLPFLLRPAIASDVVRVDSAIAFRDGGSTQAPTLTGGIRPVSTIPLGVYARAAMVHDSQDGLPSGTIVSNPVVFGLFTPEVAPSLRLAVFAGVTLPIGGGGGNTPDLASRRASIAGIYARQAMDNALFATNYVTPTAGIGVAWVRDGWTIQAETTLLELVRARGSNVDHDDTRTNLTAGAHIGYQIIPWLIASVETHYQRWLTTPAPVQKDSSARDQLTLGGGLRASIPLSSKVLMRPGLAYFHPVDDPMVHAKYRVIQLDVPVLF